MKKKPTNEIELSTLVSEADAELLKQKQAIIRERAKPILKHKEAMEKSIVECEKDLAEARKILAGYSIKLQDVLDNDNMQLFEELEKIVREGKTKLYQRETECCTTGYTSASFPDYCTSYTSPTYTFGCPSTPSTWITLA